MKKILLIILIFVLGAFSIVFGRLLASEVVGEIPNNNENVTINDPIDIPKVEPIYEEPQVIENTKIDLAVVGDIMFHMPQITGAKREDGFDFYEPFKYILPFISKADYSMANFETVTVGNEKGFSGFPMFNSPVETIDGIGRAGFDLLFTSNNHSLDRGKSGIINTIKEIESRDIDFVGTSVDERRAYIIKEINGIKLAIFSYTQALNGLETRLSSEELDKMINRIDIDMIKEDFLIAMEENPDYTIIYLHWGNEYNRDSSDFQKKLAKELAQIGFDLVLGSHPHVIQEMETILEFGKETHVIYSMGNFISNQRYETMGVSYTEDGVIMNITLNKNHLEEKTTLVSVKAIPTWVYRYWQDNRFNYYILPTEDILDGSLNMELSEEILKRIEKSRNDTLSKLKLD